MRVHGLTSCVALNMLFCAQRVTSPLSDHIKIRDLTANLPVLYPLDGEVLTRSSSNDQDGARLDDCC